MNQQEGQEEQGVAAEGPGEGRGLRDGFTSVVVGPPRERSVELEHEPGEDKGHERHPKQPAEVEARTVEQAAQGPSPLGRAEDPDEPSGQERLEGEVDDARGRGPWGRRTRPGPPRCRLRLHDAKRPAGR